MNPHGEENSFCYFHPKEFLVGVCAHCLKERLLSLTSKQTHLLLPKNHNTVLRGLRRKPSIVLPKVFAFSSFFPRFEARAQKPNEEGNNESSIASLEDSFISIKFEADGSGLWEERKKKSSEGRSWLNCRAKSVVEKAKVQSGLRWRKRIGQLVQLVGWNKSSKAGVSHNGFVRKMERVRGRRGWIRNLTRSSVSTTE